jgi:hypothetical protein
MDPEEINEVTVHRGSSAGTGGIINRAGGIAFVFPKKFARIRIKAQEAFRAGDGVFVNGFGSVWIGREAIWEKHAAIGHGGAGVAFAAFHFPEDFGSGGWEGGAEILLAENAVAFRAHPLGPVLGAKKSRAEQSEEQKKGGVPRHTRRVSMVGPGRQGT